MYITTNSALVWKRMADENQQSARLLARICIGLLVLVIGAGIYAFLTQSRFNELCSTISHETISAQSPYVKELGDGIRKAYCT